MHVARKGRYAILPAIRARRAMIGIPAMSHSRAILVLVLAAVLAAGARAASAQPQSGRPSTEVAAGLAAAAANLDDSQIEIAYVAPRNAELRPYYDELRRRRVLEELRRFLSPLLLPRKLVVKTDECGRETVRYQPGMPIVACYEYVARIVKLAPATATPSGVSRENAIVGAFVQLMLHEVSYAVFDLLEVPVWGRADDAADRLAAFIMLQLGKDVAVRTITGAVWFFEASNRTWTGSDFASTAAPESQRLYNYLCIAYGSDRATFEPIVRDTLLKTSRARRCIGEYQQLDASFEQAILPHLDPGRLAKVRATRWLAPEE
jgi:hypothetical protein